MFHVEKNPKLFTLFVQLYLQKIAPCLPDQDDATYSDIMSK